MGLNLKESEELYYLERAKRWAARKGVPFDRHEQERLNFLKSKNRVQAYPITRISIRYGKASHSVN